MGLYHYTTETRLANIFDTEIFRPSSNIQIDLTYGEGWYFTDLPPYTCDYLLMQVLWQRTTMHQRVKNFVELEVIGGTPLKKRSNVYFVKKSPYVSFHIVSHGEAPMCCLDRIKCSNRPSNLLRQYLLSDMR